MTDTLTNEQQEIARCVISRARGSSSLNSASRKAWTCSWCFSTTPWVLGHAAVPWMITGWVGSTGETSRIFNVRVRTMYSESSSSSLTLFCVTSAGLVSGGGTASGDAPPSPSVTWRFFSPWENLHLSPNRQVPSLFQLPHMSCLPLPFSLPLPLPFGSPLLGPGGAWPYFFSPLWRNLQGYSAHLCPLAQLTQSF